MRLTLFLPAYNASTHKTTDMPPISIMSGRELCLLCNPLFEAPTNKRQPMADYKEDLMEQLHDIIMPFNIRRWPVIG
jgi:hypothetical protein